MGIKNRLKEIRMKEYLMNQKEFAKHLDIYLTTYNTWEQEKSNPKLEIALKIANKINKRIDDIWYLD